MTTHRSSFTKAAYKEGKIKMDYVELIYKDGVKVRDDTTEQKLDEIKTQLDSIQEQLGNVENGTY